MVAPKTRIAQKQRHHRLATTACYPPDAIRILDAKSFGSLYVLATSGAHRYPLAKRVLKIACVLTGNIAAIMLISLRVVMLVVVHLVMVAMVPVIIQTQVIPIRVCAPTRNFTIMNNTIASIVAVDGVHQY